MHVTSTLLCRANQKVYELLDITGLIKGSTLKALHETKGKPVSLPHQIYELKRSETTGSYVVVYRDLPLESAVLKLAEIDKHGALLDTQDIGVSFAKAKWKSRLNYRTRRSECDVIRCIDERTPPFGDASIKFYTAVSAPSHIILKGQMILPAAVDPLTTALSFVNDRLENVVSEPLMLHPCALSSTVPNVEPAHSVSFSCRIPWNQGDLSVLLYDTKTGVVHLNQLFTQKECDTLRESMDRLLYHHSGLDPYYGEWLKLHRATPATLELQREHQIANSPRFSIIVPLYKTPIPLFQEMVESVIAQTHRNWELILVNASPEIPDLAKEIDRFCRQDKRIKVVVLSNNLGISENTNAGIAAATGDYIAFFDHDDLLEPDALYEYARAINDDPDIDLLYCDEDKLMPDGSYSQPFFKPDFSIDMLRNNNYVCHMLTIRKSLLDTLEPNTSIFDGAQDHNLTLEASERTKHIHHVAKVLYHWRITPNSTASGADAKPYALEAGLKAVRNHLKRMGLGATVTAADRPFTYQVIYNVPDDRPLVSIIIPTKDHAELLEQCVTSIVEKTTYEHYEIILVDNGSTEQRTHELYDRLRGELSNKLSIVIWNHPFNFSSMVNAGVAACHGDYVLLLNNDTKVITPEWMDIMLGICSRKDVGAVGVKLLYPDDTVQHAGVNITDEPGHFFRHLPNGSHSYFELLECPRNLCAVTAACMLTKRSEFERVGGFSEDLAVTYNDIDYCFKLRKAGFQIVYTPYVELYHYESISRGFDEDPVSRTRYIREKAMLTARWAEYFAQPDPYYTPNLRPSLPETCYYTF